MCGVQLTRNYISVALREEMRKLLTCKLFTTGTGDTGDLTGPIPSKNVYSALSVLIIVQDAPSLIISLLGSLGQGVAFREKKHVNRIIISLNHTVLQCHYWGFFYEGGLFSWIKSNKYNKEEELD